VVDDGKVRMKDVKATGPQDGFYIIDGETPRWAPRGQAPPDDLVDGERVRKDRRMSDIDRPTAATSARARRASTGAPRRSRSSSAARA
jgi:hypothetical protein